MGAFCLVRKDADRHQRFASPQSIKGIFAKQGFLSPTIFTTEHFDLYLYAKLNGTGAPVYLLDNRNFCASTGTMYYRDAFGTDAVEKLFHDFKCGCFDIEQVYGQYAIIVCIDGTAQVFCDVAGVYKLYVDVGRRFFSTSFLAVAECVPSRTLDVQAAYEYIFQGATYGWETVLQEVKILAGGTLAAISGSVSETKFTTFRPRRFSAAPFAEHLKRSLDNLRNYFSLIVKPFGERIDCALSGGYDTRLMLALLREQGLRPRLHVYGRADDPDVAIAKAIAAGEGLRLEHTDKSTYPRVEPGDFGRIVRTNFYAFDGCPADGILDNGADLETRRRRCSNGELMLNGGGGEVFRNFFYLADLKYTVRQFLWAFYSQFDRTVCTNWFSEERYYELLGRKIQSVIGRQTNELERYEIEYLYPLFRGCFWMGKNASVNNRLGSATVPFGDYKIIKDAVEIPLEYKNHGRFEAQMIDIIDPNLAGYGSVYGHDFSSPPPASYVFKSYINMLKPTFFRKFTYRIKYAKKANVPYFLAHEYLSNILDASFPYTSKLVRIERSRDPNQFRRICTLEYLCQTLNINDRV